MPRRGVTKAHENRRIRQEALREQLAAQGHHQHISDLLEKLMNADEDLDSLWIQRIKIAIETKLALTRKYMPDVKAVEMVVEANVNFEDMTDEQLRDIAAGKPSNA